MAALWVTHFAIFTDLKEVNIRENCLRKRQNDKKSGKSWQRLVQQQLFYVKKDNSEQIYLAMITNRPFLIFTFKLKFKVG